MTVSPDPSPRVTRPLRAYLGPALIALVVLGLLLAVNALIRSRLTVREMVTLLQSLQDRGWAIPAFLGLYLVSSTFFAPVALFHIVAGVTWGFERGAVLSVLACNVSATLQFLLARRLGKHRVDTWVQKK